MSDLPNTCRVRFTIVYESQEQAKQLEPMFLATRPSAYRMEVLSVSGQPVWTEEGDVSAWLDGR